MPFDASSATSLSLKESLTAPCSSYTPSLSQPFNSLSTLITTLPHVPPRIRELAILATASAQKASYVLNAHTNIGQALGLSPTQISAACSGQVPSDLSKAEEVGLSFAIQLVRREGPLNAKVWHAAKDELGMEGVAELAHVIGAYAHVCLFQNAAGVGEQSGSQL